MVRSIAAGALALALVGAGCMIVTGSTDGYAPQPSSLQCLGPSDCEAGVCCYGLGTDGGAGSSCQPSCPFAFQQACTASDQCGDAGCLVQTCAVVGGAVQVATCGAIAECAQ
jgi:hypothetical protein